MDNVKIENDKPPSLSGVSHETVEIAVEMLLKWIKSKAMDQQPQLSRHDRHICLVIKLKPIPDSINAIPSSIPVPHPLFHFDGGQKVCLIISETEGLNAEVAENKIKEEGLPVSKVFGYSKLYADNKLFANKFKLCGSFDLFMADKAIYGMVPRLLGPAFFTRKRNPIPVDLTKEQWRGQMETACSSALLSIKGSCCSVRVARGSQTSREIVENVVAVIDGLASTIPKMWENISSMYLKFLDSLVFPVYQSFEILNEIESGKTESQMDEPENNAEKGVTSELSSKKKKRKRKRKNGLSSGGQIADDKVPKDESPAEKGVTSELSSKKKKRKRKNGLSSGGGIADDNVQKDESPAASVSKKKNKSVGLQGGEVVNTIKAKTKKKGRNNRRKEGKMKESKESSVRAT